MKNDDLDIEVSKNQYNSIESELHKNRLKQRNIYLFSEIDDIVLENVILDLFYLDSINHNPINIYINSPGGVTSDGFAIIDVLKRLKSPIRTIGLGEVCSMACAIFVVGTKGLREIGENTWFMFHPITSGMKEDYVKFQKSRILQAEELEKQYDKIILKHTNIPEDVYKKAKDTELWLPAKKVLEYQIADKIYE